MRQLRLQKAMLNLKLMLQLENIKFRLTLVEVTIILKVPLQNRLMSNSQSLLGELMRKIQFVI